MANELAYMAAKMYHDTIEDAKISIEMFGSNSGGAIDTELATHILKIAPTSDGQGMARHTDISDLLRLYRLATLERAEWQERLKEPS